MKTETKTVEVYVTEDGREWTDKKEAQAHEMMLENTKFFEVRSSPDLTEGRGYQNMIRVSVSGPGAKYWHELLLRDWCIRQYGGVVGFIMGCAHAPMPLWTIHQIDAAEFSKNEPDRRCSLNEIEVEQKVLIQNKKTGLLEVTHDKPLQ